jgi:hypothetical protein
MRSLAIYILAIFAFVFLINEAYADKLDSSSQVLKNGTFSGDKECKSFNKTILRIITLNCLT